MTEIKKNIYEKLLDVMQEVRYIEKEKKTVNNQYRFVSHDAVTAATSEAFIKHKVYAKPRIVKSEITTIEVERPKWINKVETLIKETNFVCSVEVEYDFINVENPSDKICGVNGLGQGIDSQDKACGKAISYACKYALLKALGIETGDDPEKDVNFNVASQPKNKPVAKALAESADAEMKETLDKKNEQDFAGLKSIIENCGSLEELTKVRNDKENIKIVNSLKKWRPDLFNKIVAARDFMEKELSVDPAMEEAQLLTNRDRE